jgi:hypothetical protein
MNDDYDSPWKDALQRYFPEFMAFYFPSAHAQVDWSVPYVFLEQELAQVTHDAELGNRRLDKLVRVTQHGGAEQWVLIHIDIQAGYDRHFGERMFVYNYRIYDRYRRPVATLAVLADGRKRWRPESFGYALFGCEVTIRFPVIKLHDFAGRQEELLHEENVFGMVTAAHLLTQQSRHQPVQRYAAKWKLARLLYQRNWDKQRIADLFGVIDWMLAIPPDLQHKLMLKIEELERELDMPYLNSFERRGLERGREEGREEGREAGREEGLLALREVLRTLAEQRFGPLPDVFSEKIQSAGTQQLRSWARSVLSAPSLDTLFTGR